MSEYIHLTGAEDVRAAGRQIADAAETFSRAAATLDAALFRHARTMEALLDRLEAALAARNSEVER